MDATQDHGKLIFARFALAARATDSDSAVFGQTFAIAAAVFVSFGGLWRHMEVGGLIIFGWRAAIDSAVFGQTFAIAVRTRDSDSAFFGSFGGLWRHMESRGLIIFGWRAAVASKVTRPSELE